MTTLQQKDIEIELLKEALRQIRDEKEHYKNNYLLLKAKYKAIEAQLEWWSFGIRGN